MIPILGVYGYAASQDGPQTLAAIARVIGIFLAIGVGTAAVILGLIRLGSWAAVRLRRAVNHEVRIGKTGVILGGQFICWKNMGVGLRAVRYEPGDPGIMEFDWLQPAASASGLPAEMATRVPVPAAENSAARELVAAFKGILR